MKRLSGTLTSWLVVWLLAAALVAVPRAWAHPTTTEQAQTVVRNWLGLNAVPLGARMGRQIKKVQTFYYEGAPAYYVVNLNPSGLVLVPADNLVEPIIAFLPSGQFDPSPANPLGALVSRDLPGRLLQARAAEAKGLESLAPEGRHARARRKWTRLTKPTAAPQPQEFSVTGISDIRVAPFVLSRWSQSTVNNQACYNYYTPPYTAGSTRNYYCGCVATAMAQLMRYWTHPLNGIGRLQKNYYVNDPYLLHPQKGYTRGGDDYGGAYVWGDMVLVPTSGVTQGQRQAIGRLTWDAGISVNMQYESDGSGAYMSDVGPALTGTFGYSNARYAENWPKNLPADNRNAMVNANLHARYPVILGIYGSPGGHAIICDGYGYNLYPTMYHHLNLGWAGIDDAWYNLPTVDTSIGTFTTFDSCIYNVYKPGTGSGSGEIIAGRVTDTGGSALSGVTVSASGTGGPYTATTDASGIYALAQVPSGTPFTLSASKTGYTFASQTVTTGTSINSTTTTGNKWPLDFVGTGVPVITSNQALDNTRLSFYTSGSANWYGQSTTWYYGGSAAQSGAITANQSSSLQTTVVGPGTLTFYWKVSSEPNHDYLNLFLDATLIDSISGSVDWDQKTVSVPDGIHTVIWQYAKDSSGSQGSDCGWVDQVVYTRSGVSKITPDYLLLLLD
jgi:hypothetical protein